MPLVYAAMSDYYLIGDGDELDRARETLADWQYLIDTSNEGDVVAASWSESPSAQARRLG